MTLMLRAAIAATVLALSSIHAFADGRADWKDYAWQQIAIADCTPAGATLKCPLYHEKWDWKRDQWVEMVIELDRAGNTMRLLQSLTNSDTYDNDHVCVTAIAVDAAGRNVVAHHQNWYINSGATAERSFAYSSRALATVATIHIGSKQCRDGARQDDALYARVLAGIQP